MSLLRALLDQVAADDRIHAILTAPDQAQDRSFAALRSLAADHPALRLLPGFGAYPGRARNIGIAAAPEARFVVQIDAGCYIGPGWLDAMLAPLLADACDYVVGRIVPHRGAEELWGLRLDREALFAALTQSRFRQPGDVAGGAAVAYRRELWEQAGSFPEDLRCGEDRVFAARIAALEPPVRVHLEEGAEAAWELGPGVRTVLRRECRYLRRNVLSGDVSVPRAAAACLVWGGAALCAPAACLAPWLGLPFLFALAWLLVKTGRKVRLYRILARPDLRNLSPAGLALFFLLNGAVRASRLWGAAQGLVRRFLNSDNTDNTDNTKNKAHHG